MTQAWNSLSHAVTCCSVHFSHFITKLKKTPSLFTFQKIYPVSWPSVAHLQSSQSSTMRICNDVATVGPLQHFFQKMANPVGDWQRLRLEGKGHKTDTQQTDLNSCLLLRFALQFKINVKTTQP